LARARGAARDPRRRPVVGPASGSARRDDGVRVGRASGDRAPSTALAGIPRRANRATAPLSFAQQQIWLHAQLAPDVPLYNEPFTIRYRGALEPAALTRALSDLIARHEAWRTVFAIEDGRAVQRVLPSSAVDVPFTDLRHLPVDAREPEAVRLATADAVRCCARGWCAWPTTTRGSTWRCTTRSSTVTRSTRSSCPNWPRSTRPRWPARGLRYPTCRSSTPTGPRGSAPRSSAAPTRASSSTGPNGSPTCRRLTCPATGRGRPCCPTVA